MPSIDDPVATVAPEGRAEVPARPRTQFGLGPGAVEATAAQVEGVSQTISTTRDTPEARAEGNGSALVVEGKVIPFPAQRREDEAPESPLEPLPVAPPIQVLREEPSPVAPSEMKPTVREPLAQRRLESGPSGTLRLDTSPAAGMVLAGLTAGESAPTPETAAELTPPLATPHQVHKTMSSSSPHNDPPPSSQGRTALGPSEDHFFKIGDAGEYEGGPSHRPPPPPPELIEHELKQRGVSIRTPEQEERRAGFIRVVVMVMGFGLAIPIMGFIAKHFFPPPVREDAAHSVEAAPPPAPVEPPVVATESPTAVVLPPPPAAAPSQSTEAAAPAPAPVTTAASPAPKPEAAATPGPAPKLDAAPKPEPVTKPAAAPKPVPAPKPVVAAKPAPVVAAKPSPKAKPAAPAGAPAAPKPTPDGPKPAAPSGTASFPVD
jgi:hypothetical protein